MGKSLGAAALAHCSAGSAGRSQAYASSGYYRRNYGNADLAAAVSTRKSQGYLGYKMKVGNIERAIHAKVLAETPLRVSIAEDLARVAAAREAVGPNCD